MANLFSYRVLQKAGVDEQGVTIYNIVSKSLALPEGGVVTDSAKLAQALTEALESIYHDELAAAEAKAAEALRSKLAKAETGEATAEDVAKAQARYKEAARKYSSYPSVPVCSDPIAKFIGYAITGTKLVKVDEASYMLTLLRSNHPDVAKCTEEIQCYFNERFNLRAEQCGYLKPYRAKLKADVVENLINLAHVFNLRWTAKGIEEVYMKELKLWQQVILAVLRDSFKLAVQKESAYDTV